MTWTGWQIFCQLSCSRKQWVASSTKHNTEKTGEHVTDTNSQKQKMRPGISSVLLSEMVLPGVFAPDQLFFLTQCDKCHESGRFGARGECPRNERSEICYCWSVFEQDGEYVALPHGALSVQDVCVTICVRQIKLHWERCAPEMRLANHLFGVWGTQLNATVIKHFRNLRVVPSSYEHSALW